MSLDTKIIKKKNKNQSPRQPSYNNYLFEFDYRYLLYELRISYNSIDRNILLKTPITKY